MLERLGYLPELSSNHWVARWKGRIESYAELSNIHHVPTHRDTGRGHLSEYTPHLKLCGPELPEDLNSRLTCAASSGFLGNSQSRLPGLGALVCRHTGDKHRSALAPEENSVWDGKAV